MLCSLQAGEHILLDVTLRERSKEKPKKTATTSFMKKSALKLGLMKQDLREKDSRKSLLSSFQRKENEKLVVGGTGCPCCKLIQNKQNGVVFHVFFQYITEFYVP